MTGLGADLMVQGLAQRSSKERAVSLLQNPAAALVCRGPKPHAVLKQLGIKPLVVVGEPNTWRDVLRAIDEQELLRGRAVYLQEYGRTNEELVLALEQRGVGSVRQIKTYAWALPEDSAPLEQAIDCIVRGEADVALFTSGVQLMHLLQVAEARGLTDALRRGLTRLVIASVGPLTSESLRAAGLPPDIEPEHPKLGHLMLALGAAREKLAEKRGSAGS
jgi:uroporphyrinogen-III synthase